MPWHGGLCTKLKKVLSKIGRDLNITLDHTNFVDDLCHLVWNDLRFAEGVRGEVMANWKAKLKGNAVGCPFVKRKQEVVTMCPQFRHSEFVDWFKKQDVIKIMQDENGKINVDFKVEC